MSLCFLVSTGPNTFILRAQSVRAIYYLIMHEFVCAMYVNHDLSFCNIIKAFGSREPFKKACTYDLVLVHEVPLMYYHVCGNNFFLNNV